MKKIVFILLVLSSFFVCENVFAYEFEFDNNNSGIVEYRYASNHVFTSNSTLNTISNFNGLSGKFIRFENLTSWQYAFAYGFSIPMNSFELSDYEKQDFTFTFYLNSSVDLSSIHLRSVFTNDYDKFGSNYEFNKDIGLADNQLLYYEDYAFITSFPRCDSETDPRVHKCTVKVSANLNLINKKFNNERMYFIVLFGRNYESIYYENITFPTNFSYDVSYDSSTELSPNNDIDWTNEEIVKKSFWDRLGEAVLSIIKLPLKLIELLLDLLKSLFIPSEDYFKGKIDVIDKLANEKLGFLYVPIELTKQLVSFITDIPENPSANFVIPKVDFMGTTIIPSMSVDLIDIVNSNDNFKNIYEVYKIVTSGLIVLWLCDLAYKEYRIIVNGGSV